MYGSFVNRVMESSRYPEIKPGMGATFCYWSDRRPGTVVAVRYAKDGKTVREIDLVTDKTGPNKATWPAQDYDITPGWNVGDAAPADHLIITYRMDGKGYLRKTYVNDGGRRVMVGRNDGPGLVLGSRDAYTDPSF